MQVKLIGNAFRQHIAFVISYKNVNAIVVFAREVLITKKYLKSLLKVSGNS